MAERARTIRRNHRVLLRVWPDKRIPGLPTPIAHARCLSQKALSKQHWSWFKGTVAHESIRFGVMVGRISSKMRSTFASSDTSTVACLPLHDPSSSGRNVGRGNRRPLFITSEELEGWDRQHFVGYYRAISPSDVARLARNAGIHNVRGDVPRSHIPICHVRPWKGLARSSQPRARNANASRRRHREPARQHACAQLRGKRVDLITSE